MIRRAETKDIPRLLDMGERFAAKARLFEHVGYDPTSMAETFRLMIEGDRFCLFVGERGAIGGMVAPHPFNHSRMVADELFWWSEGREGLRLLRAYEDWAGSFGAVIRMTTLEAVEPERVGKLFERRGYQPLERAFVKVN